MDPEYLLRISPVFITMILAVFFALVGCGEKTYSVSGKIVDSITNAGIPEVMIFTDSGLITQSGTFTITGLSGTASLYFFQDGWSFSPNPLEVSGEETELEVRRIPQALNIVEPKIAGGWGSTIMLKSDGSVWTWGYNSYGQLGNGTITDSNLPGRVPGLSNTITVDAGRFNNMDVVAIAAGSMHSLALKDDGSVWAWGHNGYGELGTGNNDNTNTPVAGTF